MAQTPIRFPLNGKRHQAVQRGLLGSVARHLARERRRWPCGSNYCAMASTARSIHRSGSALSTPAQSRRLIKKTESAYPRPSDRRLSRKTRAAVGKPPDTTAASPAVRSADSPGAKPPSVRQRENTSTPLLLRPLELCVCETCGTPIMLDGKQKRIRAVAPNLMGHNAAKLPATCHVFYDPANAVPGPNDGRPVYEGLRPEIVWPSGLQGPISVPAPWPLRPSRQSRTRGTGGSLRVIC